MRKIKQYGSRFCVYLLTFLLLFQHFGLLRVQAETLDRGQLAFKNIYSTKAHGQIKIIGNTLRMPDKRYYSQSLINAYGKAGIGAGGSSMNNDLYMGEVDADKDPSTRNSSGVKVEIPANSTIEKAFLVWGGSASAGDKTRTNGKTTGTLPQEEPKAASETELAAGPVIKFKTPQMTAYTVVRPVESNRLTNYRKDYTAYADVTDLVQAGGAGEYWAGDLPLSTGYDTYGGWALVLVYFDQTLPKNDLNVFFGHRVADSTTQIDTTLSGLVTPPAGTVHAKVGMVVWEGDQPGTGDVMTVGKTPDINKNHKVTDTYTPDNNIGNSTVTYAGSLLTDRYPNYNNNHGMDAKVINIDGVMENNQDTLGISMKSTGDVYYPTILTTEVELYAPNVQIKKSVKNITRPNSKIATTGDILEYTIDLKNTGYDTATLNVATDSLPDIVDYVPGSIVHMENGVRVPRTDAPRDDDAEFVADKNHLVFHVGDGATHDKGGTLVYEQSSTYKYRVVLKAEGAGSAIVNKVLVEYAGSDGEKSSGGSSNDKSELKSEPQNPAFELVKSSDKASDYKLKVGDVINYTFTLRNTGNVKLTDVTLEDPLPNLSELHFPDPKPVELAAKGEEGDSFNVTATYTVTQADVNKGKVSNTATATAKTPAGEVLTREASLNIPGEIKPQLNLTKTSDKDSTPASELKVGTVVTYTFTVQNTGNVTISNLGLSDELADVQLGNFNKTQLEPNETAQATGTYVIKQADVDAGKIVNTAQAQGTDPANNNVKSAKATNTLPIAQNPAMTFAKTTDKPADYKLTEGDTITYTFTVNNTGDVTLSNLTLTDNMPNLQMAGVLTPASIAPGQTAKVTATYRVTQNDVDAGKVENTATVTGMPPQTGETPPEPLTKTSTVTVPAEHKPAIKLTKTANKTELVAGQTITYTFTVENTGNVTLTNVSVSDPMPGLSTGSPSLNKTTLAPGDTATATATYVVKQDDVDRGSVKNTATATGTPPAKDGVPGVPVTDEKSVTVPAEHNPEMTFAKTTDKDPDYKLTEGDTITYTFTVKNTGNVTLSNLQLTDEMAGLNITSALNPTTLAPGQTATATGTYLVKQEDVDRGSVKNTATVTGNPPTIPGETPPEPLTKTSTVTVPAEHKPAIKLTKTADKTELVAGQTITYTFTVENTGNVTLTDVSVSDQMPGLSTSSPSLNKTTLAPGDTAMATATYLVKQDDVDAGKVKNTATATGTPPAKDGVPGVPVTDEKSVTVPAEHNPEMTFAKTTDKDPDYKLTEGDTITYTFTVKNTGNVTLSNLQLTDEMAGLNITSALNPTTLAPGQTATATGTYLVKQEDVDAGSIKNTATVTGNPPTIPGETPPEPLTKTSTVTVPAEHKPAIKLTKTADKTELVAGQTITYTFTVENTGNVTLTNVSVSDPMPGLSTGSPSLNKTTLAPGDTATATATYVVKQDDVDAGKIKNTATATGTPPAKDGVPGVPVTDEKSVTVPAEHNPEMTFAKTTDKDPDYKLTEGDTITYTFTVKNTGNVTLSNLQLTDEMAGLNITSALNPTTLAPGQTATATGTYLVKQEDVDAGSIKNTATVTGNPPTIPGETPPEPLTKTSTVTVPAEHKPAMTFEKTTDKAADYKLTEGDTITYTFTVKNTGNVTLSNLELTDAMTGLQITNPLNPTSLAPGQTATATGTYEIKQSDVDAGKVENTATVTGTPPQTGETPPTPLTKTSKVTVPAEHKPAIKLTKTADKTELVAGQTITYTFAVENTGNVTLTNVSVSDPMPGLSTSSPSLNKTTLAPGDTATATATYTVTQEDVDRGSVKNTATVTGTPPQTGETPPTPVTETSTVTVPSDQQPAMTFDKTTDKAADYKLTVGDTITYTFTVKNTGNVTLSNLELTDAMTGLQITNPLNPTSLAPGQTATATGTYLVTQDDVDAGKVENTATVTGTPPQTGETPPTPLTKTSKVTVPAEHKPAIELTKTADKNELVAGQTITYTFTVKNTGNVTLTNVSISDPMPGLSTSSPSLSKTTLAPNETATATATYLVTQDDVDAGKVKNTATITGTPPQTGETPPTPVTETSTVTVPSDPQPAMTFEKTTDKAADYKLTVGDTITYTFTVKNTGNVTLSNLELTDAMPGLQITNPLNPTSLAPGQTATATGTYEIKQSDVDAGKVKNTATVTGTPPQTGETPPTPLTKTSTVTVPAEHKPAIELTKTADKTELVAGQTITYTFTVKNTGNVTLTNISISDPMPGLSTSSPSLSKTTLAPNETATATANYVVTQEDVNRGSVKNTATVTGTPPQTGETPPTPVTETSTVTVPSDPQPAMTFEKTTDKAADYKLTVGDTITYTFTVKNTGNVTLNNLQLTDEMAGLNITSALNPTTLAPGQTATATGTYEIKQSDVDAGKVENTATVTGTPPQTGETPPTPLTKTSTVTVPSDPQPAMTFAKTTDKAADYKLTVGDTITYTFTVKNTGNVTLNNLALTDEMDGLNITSALSPTTLAPGQTATATGTYEIKQSDVDAGKVKNTATVTGTPPQTGETPPTPVTETSTVTVPSDPQPAMTFEKTTDKAADYKLTVGDTITYTFTVKNTGNVTLNNLALTDEMDGLNITSALSPTTLAPGQTATATGTYEIKQSDVDAGKVENTATVTGTPPQTGETPPTPLTKTSTVTVPAEHKPAIELTKTADKTELVAGQTITYTFTVKNTGNVTLTNVSINDPMPGLSTSSPSLNKTTLAPNETATATATYTVTQEDVDRGSVKNTATVTGTPPQTGETPPTPVTETSTVTVPSDPQPAMTFEKTTDKAADYKLTVGDTITYTFTVKNTGNVTLNNLQLTDEMAGLNITSALNPTTLAPNETATATATYTVTQEDVDRGSVKNTATVTGTPPQTGETPPTPVTETSTVTVPAEHKPDMHFEKTTDKAADYKLTVGDTITYTFTVKNTGNVTLSNLTLTDKMPNLKFTQALTPTVLRPGEKAVAKATYIVTEADVKAGKLVNEAEVTALPPTIPGEEPPAPLKKRASVTLISEPSPTTTTNHGGSVIIITPPEPSQTTQPPRATIVTPVTKTGETKTSVNTLIYIVSTAALLLAVSKLMKRRHTS